MPVLKHAKKKLRQDVKRTRQNKRVKTLYKDLLKKAKATPNTETMSAAFSSIDKAAKLFVIHKNKAARLKSSLAKIASGGDAGRAASAATAKPSRAKGTAAKKKTATKKSSGKKK